MSTFDGFVREFPDIQVDYFRTTQATASRRPLAGFLSHAHSDHLVGLDALRSPFVYCSAATRALVLGLEKYPCRINFAKGILETRKRTYRHLKHLLKPLPFNTPIPIELSPGNRIQVTLFDANHCPGSTMFLFEDECKAAIYTGDTRLEPWFVNSLVRNPCLAEYTAGLRTIDTVYLDTTFIERDVYFQTKAEGLSQLLQAVSRYPPDTIFYLRAWTFGYEEVWTALAKALRSKIHIDAYKMDLYQSLAPRTTQSAAHQRPGSENQAHIYPLAPSLVGFMGANTAHEGCLTVHDSVDSDQVRIHSCEQGLDYCSAIRDSTRPVVWIRPVVCRLPHGQGEVPEVGAGGGGEDLNKEAELEVCGQEEIDRLCELIFATKGMCQDEKLDLQTLMETSLQGSRQIPLHVRPEHIADKQLGRDVVSKIEEAVREMAHLNQGTADAASTRIKMEASGLKITKSLSKTITFSYSRHSSYQEQCDLLEKLRPRDVWPCTFHPERWFDRGQPVITIEDLFGRYCSGSTFHHDVEAYEKYGRRVETGDENVEIIDSQVTTQPEQDSYLEPMTQSEMQDEPQHENQPLINTLKPHAPTATRRYPVPNCADLPYFYHSTSSSYRPILEDNEDSQSTQVPEFSAELRLASHQAMVGNAIGDSEWSHIVLTSTTDNHTMPDVDLGSG